MGLEIEKNIPMPPPACESVAATVKKMKIGDSVLVKKQWEIVNVKKKARVFGYKMAQRKIHGEGTRIW